MVNLETGFIDLKDGQLYYEAAGSGSPVVLVHAGFVCRTWNVRQISISSLSTF